MEPLTIRPGRQEDIGPLGILLARSYPRLLAADYPPSVPVTAIPRISKAQPALVMTCGTCFIALHAGKLVGDGGRTRAAPGKNIKVQPAVGHILYFATDERAMRLGIGSAVMARVLHTATGADIRVPDCLSTRTAVPFYRPHGFEAVENVDVPLGAGIVFPAIRMIRRRAPRNL